MTPNIENLLATWDNRPRRMLECGNEDDWGVILGIMGALKSAVVDIRNMAKANALPPSVSRNPNSGVTAAGNGSDAPTGQPEAKEAWKPRWLRAEITNPFLESGGRVFSTPSNAEPSAPATEPSSHTQPESQRTDGSAAVNGQTLDTSGTPATADAKLAAARRVAATSKPPSSRTRAARQPKRSRATLP